jgi:hypothetical protein
MLNRWLRLVSGALAITVAAVTAATLAAAALATAALAAAALAAALATPIVAAVHPPADVVHQHVHVCK